MLGSCGSSKDDADEPGVPDVNPQLDWNFTYETSQTDDGVVIKWKVEEKTKSISEKGETRIFCKPGRDRFFPPEWGDLYEAKQTVCSHGDRGTWGMRDKFKFTRKIWKYE